MYSRYLYCAVLVSAGCQRESFPGNSFGLSRHDLFGGIASNPLVRRQSEMTLIVYDVWVNWSKQTDLGQ